MQIERWALRVYLKEDNCDIIYICHKRFSKTLYKIPPNEFKTIFGFTPRKNSWTKFYIIKE